MKGGERKGGEDGRVFYIHILLLEPRGWCPFLTQSLAEMHPVTMCVTDVYFTPMRLEGLEMSLCD